MPPNPGKPLLPAPPPTTPASVPAPVPVPVSVSSVPVSVSALSPAPPVPVLPSVPSVPSVPVLPPVPSVPVPVLSPVSAAALAVMLAVALTAVSAVVPAATPPASARPSRFGWPLAPPHPVLRPFQAPPVPYGAGHRGVDLGGPPDAPVLAAADATVVFAGTVVTRQVVSLSHANGLRTTYEPVKPLVTRGQRVARGTPIGALRPGHGGCPTPCLHWGAHRTLTGHLRHYLDPLDLLRTTRVRLLPLDQSQPRANTQPDFRTHGFTHPRLPVARTVEGRVAAGGRGKPESPAGREARTAGRRRRRKAKAAERQGSRKARQPRTARSRNSEVLEGCATGTARNRGRGIGLRVFGGRRIRLRAVR